MARLPDPPDWARIAQDFPVNQQLIWLNSCGIAPMPRPVQLAVQEHLQAYSERVIFGCRSDVDLLASLQGALAPLVGAQAAEVAPIHHTTEGMTFVSLGLSLQPGERIVLMQNEYPSNVYPWQHWAQKGVELMNIADGPTPQDVLRSAEENLTSATRVLSVSAVHWCTGMPLPLRELGSLCRARDVLFVVDGAQGVGHVPIDVKAQSIDVLAFSAWKWLLGPIGLGALYINPQVINKLAFPFKGTGSVVDDHNYFPYRDTIKPGTERYVVSTQSFTDWTHFDASLSYLQSIGFERVQQRILELADNLAERLLLLGFELTRAQFAPHRSAIVVARHQNKAATDLVVALQAAGIVAAERMGWLRMAPHIHLSEAQLERVADTLAQLVR